MPRYIVTLTNDEIQELKALIQKGGKGYRIKHAQILLKLDQKPENKAPSVTVFTIGDVVINMGHLLSFPFAIAGIVFWIWSVKRGVPAAIQRQPYRTPKKA